MKRNYQRLKTSALPVVPAKIFFACWMLLLAAPSDSFSREVLLKSPLSFRSTGTSHLNLPPVKLTSFTVKALAKDKVVLNWNTAQEQNFSHFTIERSVDGIDFYDAGIIFSMDDSEKTRAYTFTDKLKVGDPATIHYRLKMVDVGGKSQSSSIKTVKFGEENANGSAFLYGETCPAAHS